MDGRQGRQTPLYASPSVSGQFVHPLDYLLLPIDPVQVIAQNRQSGRLQDAGVLQDNSIGSWGERAPAGEQQAVLILGSPGGASPVRSLLSMRFRSESTQKSFPALLSRAKDTGLKRPVAKRHSLSVPSRLAASIFAERSCMVVKYMYLRRRNATPEEKRHT